MAQVEHKIYQEIEKRQEAENEILGLKKMNEQLKSIINKENNDQPDAFEGEIPEDDFIKIVKKLENCNLLFLTLFSTLKITLN